MNKLVNDAYELDKEDVDMLDNYYLKMSGQKVSDGQTVQKLSQHVWNCCGEVLEVDFEKRVFTAELVELEGLKFIRITDDLPGWLLRKGTCFKVDIPEELINNTTIEVLNPKPLDYTYMDNERLSEYIEQNMYAVGVQSE